MSIEALDETEFEPRQLILPLAMRKWRDNTFWNSKEGSNYLQLASQPLILLNGLTEILTHYLGKETIECLKRNYGTLRDVFEHSSPTTQCGNIEYENKGSCWICGGDILEVENFTNECEHVFPIAQALVFTGLYEHALCESLSDNLNGDLSVAYKENLKKEYRDSHRICNQLKNDSHFIEYNEAEGTFFIDDNKINTFLTNLAKTDNWGGGAALCKYLYEQDYTNKIIKTPLISLKKQIEYGELKLQGRVDHIHTVCNKIIEEVNNLGLTAKDHACEMAMNCKEYIATHDECGEEEVVPNTKPTVSKGAPTLQPTMITSGALKKYWESKGSYLQSCSNKLFGAHSILLRPLLKVAGITARDRTMITTHLIDIEENIKKQVINFMVEGIAPFKINLFNYLYKSKNDELEAKSKSWDNNDKLQLFSIYQVLSSQIPQYIMILKFCDLFNTSNVEFYRQQINGESIVDGADLINLKSTILLSYATKLFPVIFNRAATEYDEPVSMIQEILNEIYAAPVVVTDEGQIIDFFKLFKQGGGYRKSNRRSSKTHKQRRSRRNVATRVNRKKRTRRSKK
jgi:hypothetical protein